jgi:pimeloyl-ACP methyl ester carboxylesterase
MTEVLGYSRYGAQGGDFGTQVTSRIGRDHRDHVTRIHLNLMGATPALDSARLTSAEEAFMAQAEHFFTAEGAYAQMQGTRPATLAAGLSDSPAGLAAWIVEKFRAWSDCDGDVESVFSKDELLTDITLYWLTNSIATSARLYYETMHTEGMIGRNVPGYVGTPTGFASFAKDNFTPPREWVARKYNLQRFTEFERGDHFAALERPADLGRRPRVSRGVRLDWDAAQVTITRKDACGPMPCLGAWPVRSGLSTRWVREGVAGVRARDQ